MHKKIVVTTLLFPDFEVLDVFGPLEMFGLSGMLNKEIELKFVSETGGLVKSNVGPQSASDYSFDDDVISDVLIVPGGNGTRVQVENPVLINWLKKQTERTQIVTSVCTGAALLAKAGILDGCSATTNKMVFDWVSSINEKVHWIPKARWVKSGNIYTSSGVSAGMDMALSVIEELYDLEHAQKVANCAEYRWDRDSENDPFAELYGLA